MDQLTTYRAEGKGNGLVFLFKYDLNGNLKAFEIPDGQLNNEQMFWLFSSNFPATEQLIKDNWMKVSKFKKHFNLIRSAPDLSFESLWELYDNKHAKADAIKSFKKLNEADIIKCFVAIPHYDKYLAKSQVAKAHLSTFINKRRFEDEWQKEK